MERGINKIVIVSLNDKFSCKVGEFLSHELDMLFCDAKDMLEYELMDRDKIAKLCTPGFLEKSEKAVFRRIATFENVVVSISFDNLLHNLEILKEGSLIVFLKIEKSLIDRKAESINLIAYEYRTETLEKLSAVALDVEELEEKVVCEKIIGALGGIL